MSQENLTTKLNTALSSLSRAELLMFPTPIHRLSNAEQKLSHEGIYIKRDDLTGLGPGGKKLRSLEFILGEAVSLGADTIVVHGPGQSNLCTAAAAACAKLGLRCISVHNSDKPASYEGNLLLNNMLGIESHFLGSVSQKEREAYAAELTEKLKSLGARPYEIKKGGMTGLGIIGYVKLALELFNQCREQNLPVKTLFVPAGNGGLAGLVYGNALLDCPFDIVMISVEYSISELSETLKRCIADSEKILKLPFEKPLDEAVTILDCYRGDGWGCSTPESSDAVYSMPKTEGIFIEHVYNSKVWVGLEDCIRKGSVKGGACYFHSGGFSSLFSQIKV